MDKLDSTDFWQVVSIVVALVVSFLPSIKPVKGINLYSGLLMFLFICAVITAVSTTISKSVSDKENYTNLVNGAESTLKRVNQNMDTSQKIMTITNESIKRLQDIQDKNIQLQNEAAIINKKSTLIQQSSEVLQKQLADEIQIQRQTNKTAKEIVKNILEESERVKKGNQIKLMVGYVELTLMKFNLYDALQPVQTNWTATLLDFQSKFKSIVPNYDSLVKIQNYRALDSIDIAMQNDYKKLFEGISKVQDSIDNSLSVRIKNTKPGMAFMIKDSLHFINGVKQYLSETSNLLVAQLANPILQKERKLFLDWLEFFNKLYVKKELFLIDKTTITNIKDVQTLLDEHDKFLRNVLIFHRVFQTPLDLPEK